MHPAVELASRLVRLPDRRALVAVDGIDGSGKTTFAKHLAEAVQDCGRPSLVVHVDDFMHVRSVRHRRGRCSPEGYLHDSYDYAALDRWVLAPLGPDGDGWFRAGCVDRERDTVVERPLRYAGDSTITIVEGLFLHRDELADRWDRSVFLDVDSATALHRKACRDGLTLDAEDPLTRRYVEGQRLYVDSCRPRQRATWVIPGA